MSLSTLVYGLSLPAAAVDLAREAVLPFIVVVVVVAFGVGEEISEKSLDKSKVKCPLST